MVEGIHAMQLSRHGGLPATRDVGALESALGRPRHKWQSGKPDLADCAAAYGFWIAKNHAFNDGNKRTALVSMATFLEDNGVAFVPPEADAVLTMLAVAAGEMNEKALAEWLRANTKLRGRRKK
jgi:death-on-curing protein